MHEQPVVESRGLEIADVSLEDKRFDACVTEALIAAGVPVEVFDARDLEPDEVVRVVCDALRVRLGEPHLHGRLEAEAVHERGCSQTAPVLAVYAAARLSGFSARTWAQA
jgi:hypothetical protein